MWNNRGDASGSTTAHESKTVKAVQCQTSGLFFKKNMAPTIPIMQLEPLSDITGVYYVQLPLEPQNVFYYFLHIYGRTFSKNL